MSNKNFHPHFEIKINISGPYLYKVNNEIRRFKKNELFVSTGTDKIMSWKKTEINIIIPVHPYNVFNRENA